MAQVVGRGPRAYRLRAVLNAVNGSTLLGRAVARAGGARTRRGPHGLLLATGYRLRVPPAPAFTLGNVVVARSDAVLARPGLLAHEARHASQYAWCAGLPMLLAYVVTSGWSWLRCGDFASYNAFERRAGLEDGGYARRSARALVREGGKTPTPGRGAV